MEETSALDALSALAQRARLRVFRMLVRAGPDGRRPGEIAATLGIPPATLSFHLKELSRAGLVTVERAGRHLHYRADFARVDALLGYLAENCCAGATCELNACATSP